MINRTVHVSRVRAHTRSGVGIAMALAAWGCTTATLAPPRTVVSVHTDPLPAAAAAADVMPQGAPAVAAPPDSATGAGAIRVSSAGPTTSAAASGTMRDATAAPLPKLPGGQAALADVPDRRVTALDASGSDIRDVTTRLAREFGLQVSMDPQVRGDVTTHLRNVTLDDALRDVVTRNGYQWAITNGVLRVTAARLETRIFTLDYVSLSRVGTASTVIQRRLASNVNNNGIANGLSTSAGSVGSPGADVITSVNAVDMWQEIRIALTGLMTPSGSTGGKTAAGSGENNSGNNGTTGAAVSGGLSVTTASSTNFSDGSNLTISPASGLINVTTSPEKMAEISAFLDAFRASVERQVLIEAKIVEVTLSKSLQYGIDWKAVSKLGHFGLDVSSGNPTAAPLGSAPTSVSTTTEPGNISFHLSGNTQIDAVLQALSTQGQVSVLSSPRTSALNNQRASFQVTTDEVFFTANRQPIFGPNGTIANYTTTIQPQQVSVGIVLDVLPQISSDNVLTMNIRPAVTSVSSIASITVDGNTAQAPVIDRREGDTMARVRAGETMVIGGLMQTKHNKDVSGVPILKDLPFIGGLFRHVSDVETRSELVVFLTPTIISGQPSH